VHEQHGQPATATAAAPTEKRCIGLEIGNMILLLSSNSSQDLHFA
jgi:hypothetical protein